MFKLPEQSEGMDTVEEQTGGVELASAGRWRSKHGDGAGFELFQPERHARMLAAAPRERGDVIGSDLETGMTAPDIHGLPFSVAALF